MIFGRLRPPPSVGLRVKSPPGAESGVEAADLPLVSIPSAPSVRSEYQESLVWGFPPNRASLGEHCTPEAVRLAQ